jgi:sulfur relay (sulfurtransferase) DsrC/TusE family protein
MVQETEDKLIFTDAFRTKDLIWDAYVGFVQHYNNYSMYKHLKVINPTICSGLIRYATDFYFETSEFYQDFKDKLGEEDIIKINNIFNSLSDEKWDYKDFLFLRRFFSKFMVVCGIKAIVREKDQMGAFARSQSEY